MSDLTDTEKNELEHVLVYLLRNNRADIIHQGLSSLCRQYGHVIMQIVIRHMISEYYEWLLVAPDVLECFLRYDTRGVTEMTIDSSGNGLLHALFYCVPMCEDVYRCASVLVEYGGSRAVSRTNDNHVTALQMAMELDVSPRDRHVYERIVALLIRNKAPLRVRCLNTHRTVLHSAVVKGNASVAVVGCLRSMPEWSALIRAKDRYDNTSLHVVRWDTDPEVIRILVCDTPRLNGLNYQYQTFFHRLVERYTSSLDKDVVSAVLDAVLALRGGNILLDIPDIRLLTIRQMLSTSELGQFPQISRLLRRGSRIRERKRISKYCTCTDPVSMETVPPDDAMILVDERVDIRWVYHQDTISRLYAVPTVLGTRSPMTRQLCLRGARRLIDVVNASDMNLYRQLYERSMEVLRDDNTTTLRFGFFQRTHQMRLRDAY